ncbi:TPA: hypothetical protein NKP42_004555 [Vibrio parahaemolyticus]|nr:hypothetical protein [Vibrio parahaemolyticus]
MALMRFITKFSELSLPIQIIISSFVVSLGSAGVLGFVSELAAFKYAYVTGFRIPFEGLSYIQFNVSGLSFLFFLSAISVFFLIGYVIKFCLRVGYGHLNDQITQDQLQELPLKEYLIKAVPGALISSHFLVGFMIQMDDWLSLLPWYFEHTIPFYPALIMLYVMRKPKHLKNTLILFYLASIAFIVLKLFDNQFYEKLLQHIKYGGGIPVKLYHTCKEGTCLIEGAKLQLRTSEFFILSSDGVISEVPNSKVDRVKY